MTLLRTRNSSNKDRSDQDGTGLLPATRTDPLHNIAMVNILFILCEILIGASLLMMIGFGLRALALGRKNYVALGSMALAGVVFLITLVIANPDNYAPILGNPVSKPEAAIVLTAVVMFFLAILALIGSAIRGLIR